jgi:hypothetical protein
VVLGLVEAMLVLLVVGGLVLGAWTAWQVLGRGPAGPAEAARLPERDRAWLAGQIERAGWSAAHDEVDGTTRILLRRNYVGLDGRPAVLEERVFDTFPATDPAWEARFTESMAGARYRCSYLNAEEGR